jgi:hypothetical protein
LVKDYWRFEGKSLSLSSGWKNQRTDKIKIQLVKAQQFYSKIILRTRYTRQKMYVAYMGLTSQNLIILYLHVSKYNMGRTT